MIPPPIEINQPTALNNLKHTLNLFVSTAQKQQ